MTIIIIKLFLCNYRIFIGHTDFEFWLDLIGELAHRKSDDYYQVIIELLLNYYSIFLGHADVWFRS